MGLTDALNLHRKLAKLEVQNLRLTRNDSRDDLLRKVSAAEGEARRIKNPELIAVALMRRADMLMAVDRDVEAISALTRARQELGKLGKADLLVFILQRLAEAHARSGDWSTVSSICQEGIEIVESYRYKVTGQYLQSTYLRFRVGLYSHGASAAFHLHDYGLMLERTELSKSRFAVLPKQTMAASNAGELTSEFETLCARIDQAAAENDGKVPEDMLLRRRTLWDLLSIQRYRDDGINRAPSFSLARIQSVLQEDEAVLYYYWFDKLTLLIATIDQKQTVAEVRTIDEKLRNELETFADFIQSLKRFTGDLKRIDNFASLLLPESAASIFTGKKRLLLSPHRLLHAFPFQAIEWRGKYLIQEFALTYIPNLSSLLITYHPAEQQKVLALGVCDYHVPGHPELKPLKDAQQEIEELKMFYEQSETSITAPDETEATEDWLREINQQGELQRFTRLHLALHGENVQSDTPMESRLFLRDTILEGLEIANWKLNADLVVLNACCAGQRSISGRGMDELPGDDLFGLQAAFFAAGARQILSSLWPLESRVARSVALRFHSYLAGGQAPDIALQAAIKEHLSNAGPQTRLIYYWAAYFLSAIGRPIAKMETN